MTLWFISDTHFSHANCLKFEVPDWDYVCPYDEQQCDAACKAEHPKVKMRPFASVEEMDELMVQNWNLHVKPPDHVYHLGDVAMRKQDLAIVKRLNGHKRLIRGNHDIFRTKDYLDVGFKEIHGVRVLDNMVFTHIPIHPLSMARFDANVHGHIHNNARLPLPYVNLSVEVIQYRPVTLGEIRERLRK